MKGVLTMEISHIGATPQPDGQKNEKKQEYLEKFTESIFSKLDKDKNGVIDKKDDIDPSMLSALKALVGKELTVSSLKKVADKLMDFTWTKDDKYNGKEAKISYDIWGDIRSVNTGAQDISEARAHMGLDKERVAKYNTEDIQTYGREYEKNNGTEREYFTWNPKTKSMDFESGSWSAKRADE